jgi:Flp pilus assembly protein TadG
VQPEDDVARPRSWEVRRCGEQGAAIVDFALVGALLTLLFVAVLQFAIVVHVKNTLVDCASAGARYGALADRSPSQGAQRTRELITADLGSAYASDVTAGHERQAGLDTVVVRVRAPLPLVGLLGAGRVMTVEGHAGAERQP